MLRVMIFIDGSNLYHSLRSAYGRMDVDYGLLCSALCGPDRTLVRGYYYNAVLDQNREPDGYKSQQKFLDHLRRAPKIEVRLGSLVYPPGASSPVEKGIDVRIATDMLVHAAKGNYDVAILVSGDTDFADALQAVKDFGRNVEVALFGERSSSRRLRDVADTVISLSPPYFEGLWFQR